MKDKRYTSVLRLGQQVRHCGNPLRADTYLGCTFGCKYCFSNTRKYYRRKDNVYGKAAISEFIKYKENRGRNIEQELINNKVPIHLGGMSDPFQHREMNDKITYKFLQIFEKYPISISTKASFLSEEYYEILDKNYHVFQISLSTDNEDRIKYTERNTPSAKDRIKFMKELKKRGFFVVLRLQPLLYIDEAISLINKLHGIVDYVIIEHMKASMNLGKKNILSTLQMTEYGLNSIPFRNYFVLPKIMVEKNISIIKEKTSVKIGCGDNFSHTMSDSLNCCGIDLYPASFENWLKYNAMQILMTGNKDVYTPDCILKEHNIPPVHINKYNKLGIKITCKRYVDDYLNDVFKSNDITLFDEL